jgi:peptidyl-tRNA hydrolase, PTH2 family
MDVNRLRDNASGLTAAQYPKQVIVIRKDLRMRRGKEIAQGAHAAIAFLASRLVVFNDPERPAGEYELALSADTRTWLAGHQTKVVLQAPNLETFQRVEQEARSRDLEVHVVVDMGVTEFDGVPTITALAIGPDRNDRIDEVTGPAGCVPLALY